MRNSYSSNLRLIALICAAFLIGAAAPGLPADPDQLPLALGQDWRTAVRQFAEMHLKHPAWGFSHSVRDYELARKLAAADRVVLDDDVLYAAAFLHDVGAFKPYEKADVDHADRGAQIVE